MKVTKKLFAFLLAAIMVMAMGVTVFAYDYNAGQGSITITNATVGEDYSIYKIFDTDSTGAGSITATEAQKTFYEGQAGNPFTFTANIAGTYNVSVTSGVSDQAVITFLEGFVDDEGNLTGGFADVVTAYGPQEEVTSASVEFDNIPYGYYLVTSSLGAVVTVDSTDPDQEVIDKNQDGGSNFTKTVGEDNEVVEIGEEFEFTLTFNATNYDGETQIMQYTITDTLPASMDLVYTEEDAATYGVDVSVGGTVDEDVTVTVVAADNNNTLTINIPWVDSEGDPKYSSPSAVTVTYTVKLNNTADIQTNIKNSAKLTWTGEDTGTSTEETVQTYALAIMKVDGEGNPLANATFAVTDNDGTAVNVSGQDGVYVVDPDSTSNTVTSPASGLIVIKGVDNITYTLTETAAPAGYNRLTTPVTVTPTSTGSTTIIIYYDEDGNVTDTVTEETSTVTSPVPVTAEVVVNVAGTTLPTTGGTGTTMIYIIGAVLVIGAGVLLVVRRRVSTK